MISYMSPEAESSVYPGHYTPRPGKEAKTNENMQRPEAPDRIPLINFDEFEDHYKIEVAIPGVQQEDIFAYIDNRLLTILIADNICLEKACTASALHEFETGNKKRQLRLPPDADTELVSAEYRDGILDLYFPKNPKAIAGNRKQIIVY